MGAWHQSLQRGLHGGGSGQRRRGVIRSGLGRPVSLLKGPARLRQRGRCGMSERNRRQLPKRTVRWRNQRRPALSENRSSCSTLYQSPAPSSTPRRTGPSPRGGRRSHTSRRRARLVSSQPDVGKPHLDQVDRLVAALKTRIRSPFLARRHAPSLADALLLHLSAEDPGSEQQHRYAAECSGVLAQASTHSAVEPLSEMSTLASLVSRRRT